MLLRDWAWNEEFNLSRSADFAVETDSITLLSGTMDILEEFAWADAEGATEDVQRVAVHSLDLPSRLRDPVGDRVSELRRLNKSIN